jgi:drug/metabolite transporter (DMT)-like permease
VLALLTVYILWGSTAPAIKVAVQSVPPFVMAFTRFLVAGSILWTWARVTRVPMPSARDWQGAAISAMFLLVLSNATYGVALESMPSGIGSLFFALTPIWNAIIAVVFYRERIAPTALAGIALGLGGLVYLFAPGGAPHVPILTVLLASGCSLSWSIGSMLQRRYPSTDVMQMSAMQMLVGCAMLGVLIPISGERFVAADFTSAALGAIAFLVVFGSIVGFSAYVWLTRTQSTALASTNAYVNPVVSIIVAVSFLGERITPSEIVATVVILAGVALMLVRAPARVTKVAANND